MGVTRTNNETGRYSSLTETGLQQQLLFDRVSGPLATLLALLEHWCSISLLPDALFMVYAASALLPFVRQ